MNLVINSKNYINNSLGINLFLNPHNIWFHRKKIQKNSLKAIQKIRK